MNILITLDKKNLMFSETMLVSLFENNDHDMDVYAMYDKGQIHGFEIKKIKKTVNKYGGRLHPIAVDLVSLLTKNGINVANKESEYIILFSYLFLPEEMTRILYIKYDSIINNDISDIYNLNVSSGTLVAGGLNYHQNNGLHCFPGARAEKGELFDIGVMLMDIAKYREFFRKNDLSRIVNEYFEKITITPAGIINKIFSNCVSTLDPMKYNFRMSIYERYLRDGNPEKDFNPVVIRYPIFDYYKMNVERKTRIMRLNDVEHGLLNRVKPHRNVYELKLYWKKNKEIHELWWNYAKKTDDYWAASVGMSVRKIIYLSVGIGLHHPVKTLNKFFRYKKMFPLFEHITNYDYEKMDNFCKEYTYDELEMYIDSLPPEKARQTMINLFKYNCVRMKKNGKVKIAFMVYSSSEWQCELLYRMFEKDDRYEPVIVVCKLGFGTPETNERAYKRTCLYFTESKETYNVVLSEDSLSDNIVNGADILFFFNNGGFLRPEKYKVENRRLYQLLVHVPYGFYFVDKMDVTHVLRFYDKIILKMSWFYFCCDELQPKVVNEQQRMGSYNVVASGFPKMDLLLERKFDERNDLWKEASLGAKKIIWAPHWLLDGTTGTFDKNYMWFYEYAKNHPETSWIVRPHPRLPYSATDRYKIFSGLQDYDDYLEEWRSLPNANVVADGDYFDIFDSSDAMILDSVSFITEYQYTGKPLLVLIPDNPCSKSEFGNLLMRRLYQAEGGDFSAIEKFIDEVVIRGDDYMERERTVFFEEYLNYKKRNNKSASQVIYDTFADNIFGKCKG